MLKPSSVTFLLSSLSFILCAQNNSQLTGKNAILNVKHTKDFSVTGEGSADNWKTTDWIDLPQRKTSGSSYKSSVKLLYSDSGIYCLYHNADIKITATKKEDFTDLWREDVVEAFFWTDETVPIYFEYELSPLNYELAILVPNRNGDFMGWKPWRYTGERRTRHATRLLYDDNNKSLPKGWIAEFFIPYALLKPLGNIPPGKGTKWRANFYRIDYDNGVSTWSWQPTQKNFHDYELFGTLVFD